MSNIKVRDLITTLCGHQTYIYYIDNILYKYLDEAITEKGNNYVNTYMISSEHKLINIITKNWKGETCGTQKK